MAVQYNSEDGWGGFIIDLYKAKKGIIDVSAEATGFFEKYKQKGQDLSQIIFEISSNKNGLDSFIHNSNLADESLINFLKDANYGTKDLDNFKKYLKETSKATSAFSDFTKKAGSAIKSLGADLASMAVMWAIGEIISLVAKGVDNFVHKVEKANEAMASSISEYKTAKSDLESINSELAEHNKKLDELSSKDKLTYAEKGQLEELQEITKELMLQQDIAEKNAERASKEAADKTVKAYETQYGKYDVTKENISNLTSQENFPMPNGTDDISTNIAAYIRATEKFNESRRELQSALRIGNDTEWLEDDVQHYTDIIEETRGLLDDNISDLQEKRLALEEEYNKAIEKRKNDLTPLSSSEQAIIDSYEAIYDSIKLVYEYTNQNDWNDMELANIFNTNGIEKTKDELIAMAKAGELSPETIESYENLNKAIQDSELFLNDGQNATEAFCEEIYACVKASNELSESLEESPVFNISSYEQQLDDIQSAITTLRSALDSFNKGELDSISVIDLMQQFPELAPYIDLAADGFGNLSEGLSMLIAQQPDSLVVELQKLKDSLTTDEERQQVDLLIDSLQRLSSYGDSGIEAYAATIGSTWGDTANVIDGVTSQFENLAKVQEAVADGLTMSATAAAELARMYPEILDHAQVTANGQITLNEEVVKNILDGDKSIIDAQIAKLEADKAVLEAKKETAIAELEIANQVGKAKGQISEEEARHQIEVLNAELNAEIDKDRQTVESYAMATQSKAQNATDFNIYAATVASDIASNMTKAAASMAESMRINSVNAQQSLSGIMQKAADVAKAIAEMATGAVTGAIEKVYSAVGGGISVSTSANSFTPTTSSYLNGDISLGEFKSGLEADIQGYIDAISNIDSQIEILKNLQLTFDSNGGIGGHGYADKVKDLEKEKDKLNDALKDKTGSGSGSGSGTDSAKSEFEDTVDFFERRIEALNDVLSLLKTGLDNVSGAFAKNKLVDAELGVTEEKLNNYTDALAMYTQKANEALSKLPADIAAKVKDGAVALTDFVGDGNKDVVEAIKEYQSWADKVSDCKQELAGLQKEIRQLELEKFNNIMEDFNDQFDLRGNSKDLISKQIDLLKEAGELIGESFFNAQIDQSQKQLGLLEAEKAQLVNQMASAVSSGRVRCCPLLQ